MLRRPLIAVMTLAALFTACDSGVPQEDYDAAQQEIADLQDWVGDLQETLAQGSEQLQVAEGVVIAYEAAFDPVNPIALSAVYAEDVVFNDEARSVRRTGRDTVIADLNDAASLFGQSRQTTTAKLLAVGGAVIEWEAAGRNLSTGSPWLFEGVSVLRIEGDRIVSETIYYDLGAAPWGN